MTLTPIEANIHMLIIIRFMTRTLKFTNQILIIDFKAIVKLSAYSVKDLALMIQFLILI